MTDAAVHWTYLRTPYAVGGYVWAVYNSPSGAGKTIEVNIHYGPEPSDTHFHFEAMSAGPYWAVMVDVPEYQVLPSNRYMVGINKSA